MVEAEVDAKVDGASAEAGTKRGGVHQVPTGHCPGCRSRGGGRGKQVRRIAAAATPCGRLNRDVSVGFGFFGVFHTHTDHSKNILNTYFGFISIQSDYPLMQVAMIHRNLH